MLGLGPEKDYGGRVGAPLGTLTPALALALTLSLSLSPTLTLALALTLTLTTPTLIRRAVGPHRRRVDQRRGLLQLPGT